MIQCLNENGNLTLESQLVFKLNILISQSYQVKDLSKMLHSFVKNSMARLMLKKKSS